MSDKTTETPAPDLPDGGPDVNVAEIVEANERFGQWLTRIGIELGLPRPGVGVRWGAQQVFDKANELWTEHLHYRALRSGLRMLLENGPMGAGHAMTLYGPGDQQLVDQVQELIRRPAPTQQPLSWPTYQMVMLPMVEGTPPCVVLPRGWVIMPEMTNMSEHGGRPNPLFESGRPGAINPTGDPDATP